MATSAHTACAEVASIKGWMNNKNQSSDKETGTDIRSAGPWLRTGRTSESNSSMASVPQARARGGKTRARLMRWI